jgi:hypothetical protein
VIDGIDSKSPAASLLSDFAGLPKIAGLHWLKIMVRRLGMEQSIDIKDEIVKYKQKFNDFSGRYPLINKFSSYANEGDVCEYINLVDKVKGV